MSVCLSLASFCRKLPTMRLLILSIIAAGSIFASASASCFNGDEHQIASSIFAVSVGDVDGDGRADVVYKRPDGSPSSWYYVTFSEDSNGSTSYGEHYVGTPLGNTLNGHASLVEDLDQDGDMDILVRTTFVHCRVMWKSTMFIPNSRRFYVSLGPKQVFP